MPWDRGSRRPEVRIEPPVRVSHAHTVLRTMLPHGMTMNLMHMDRIEMIDCHKGSVHHDMASMPIGMPSPAAPPLPAAEIQADLNPRSPPTPTYPRRRWI